MPLIHQKFRRTNFIVDDPQKCSRAISNKSKSDRIIIVTSSNSKLNSLSDKTSKAQVCIQPSEINRYLGQEFDCILFDLSEHFNVNAFTAICGCLIGGGELILNLPLPSSNSICPLLSRFIQEIKQINNEEPSKIPANDDFFIEQEQLIEKIKRCALGHAKRPLVITANRGRGKSATLGIAAGQLVKEKNKKIIITAPRKSNLNIFFQYVKRQTDDDKLINFVPPDQLVKDKPDADLVIIDEAGAIPVQILDKIIGTYNRMVFSTTTDGYEGNGQGFKIRFQQKLNTQFPQLRSATLINPMRWAINDPLEIALNKAFMLSLKLEQPKENSILKINNINYQLVSKSTLLSDQKLLKQIYTLLVEAHYQTRPSDLQKILTDSSMQVFIAFNKEDKKVFATALVCAEGKLNEKDCIQIEKGKKRLAGHLLPQSLMSHQGDINAGKLSYWRIMRIAVRSDFQRKKLGSGMLEYIEKQAKESSIQILGASFALTQSIVQFWYQSGFKCTRLALTKDSSTGSYPGEFMKPVYLSKGDNNNSYFRAVTQFQRSFFYSLASSYLNIDSSVLLTILAFQIEENSEKLADNVLSEILRYVEKARSYEMVEWQINQLVSNCLTKKIDPNLNSELTKFILLQKSLQNKSWQTIVSEFEFEGKKTAKEKVRKAIELLIRNYKPK